MTPQAKHLNAMQAAMRKAGKSEDYITRATQAFNRYRSDTPSKKGKKHVT